MLLVRSLYLAHTFIRVLDSRPCSLRVWSWDPQGTTWEPLFVQDLRPCPDLLNQNLHLNKKSKRLKFGKHQFIAAVRSLGCVLELSGEFQKSQAEASARLNKSVSISRDGSHAPEKFLRWFQVRAKAITSEGPSSLSHCRIQGSPETPGEGMTSLTHGSRAPAARDPTQKVQWLSSFQKKKEQKYISFHLIYKAFFIWVLQPLHFNFSKTGVISLGSSH